MRADADPFAADNDAARGLAGMDGLLDELREWWDSVPTLPGLLSTSLRGAGVLGASCLRGVGEVGGLGILLDDVWRRQPKPKTSLHRS